MSRFARSSSGKPPASRHLSQHDQDHRHVDGFVVAMVGVFRADDGSVFPLEGLLFKLDAGNLESCTASRTVGEPNIPAMGGRDLFYDPQA